MNFQVGSSAVAGDPRTPSDLSRPPSSEVPGDPVTTIALRIADLGLQLAREGEWVLGKKLLTMALNHWSGDVAIESIEPSLLEQAQSPPTPSDTSKYDAIRAFLNGHPGEIFSAVEIANRLELNVLTARTHLQTLVRRGDVYRLQKGRFFWPKPEDRKSVRVRLQNYCLEHPNEELSAPAIASEWGLSAQRIWSQIYALEGDGFLTRVAQGRYLYRPNENAIQIRDPLPPGLDFDPDSMRGQVRRYLAEHQGKTVRPKEIARALQFRTDSVGALLSEWVRQGSLERVEIGHYCLSTPGGFQS